VKIAIKDISLPQLARVGARDAECDAQGIVSSGGIEAACRERVTFIALRGDSQPHFTAIANFVSTLGEGIAHVFGAVSDRFT
jgi:hypothetical protein